MSLGKISIVIKFFRGCEPEMFVTSYSVNNCIYVPGKPGICFHYYCAVYDGVQIFGYVLACKFYSFVCTVHHLIIIIMQTYLKALNFKVPVRYVECVSKLSIFSPLSIIQYVGLYVFSLHISVVIIENMYIYVYILCLFIIVKSVWSMKYYPLFRVRSWNNGIIAVCLSIFLWIIQ